MIVYIASPYTNYYDKQAAVDVQIDTFAILRDLGHEPIAPLLSHYIDQRHPTSYERWMQWCLAMVGACDVVLRLPGDSDGADREAAEAKKPGKPVVYGIDSFINPGAVYEVTGDAPYKLTAGSAINGKFSTASGTLVVGYDMHNSTGTVAHSLSGKQCTFTIDDLCIPSGDYPLINFEI